MRVKAVLRWFAGKRSATSRVSSVWTVVDGLRMHARVSDQRAPAGAPAVVLVHGLAMSGRYMVPTLLGLAPWHRVYAPDMPGLGESDRPPRQLSLSEHADFLAGWMDSVGLDRAALLGNSLGCQVIVRFAIRHPGRLTKAVLVAPTIEPLARSPLRQAWRLLLDAPHEAPSMLLIAVREYLHVGPRRTWGALKEAIQAHVEERLPGVQAPTLVVRGERDPIVPERWAVAVARLLPRGRLVVIPGAPHAVNYSAAGALVRAVRPFLDGDN